jgi:hypothetical protein
LLDDQIASLQMMVMKTSSGMAMWASHGRRSTGSMATCKRCPRADAAVPAYAPVVKSDSARPCGCRHLAFPDLPRDVIDRCVPLHRFEVYGVALYVALNNIFGGDRCCSKPEATP